MGLQTVTASAQVSPVVVALTEPLAARLYAAADDGDGEACHALGVAYSTAPGTLRDLIEAHKWFNLAAMYGQEEGGWCRSDIAAEMSAREIAEAQRRAREWLRGCQSKAA